MKKSITLESLRPRLKDVSGKDSVKRIKQAKKEIKAGQTISLEELRARIERTDI